MAATVTVTAPAKVNLYLHITGKRADGYHLLDSVAGFTECGDVLELAPADMISCNVAGPFAGALAVESDNLVVRAARALQKYRDVRKGAIITLHKHLPVGAGLGGGSSDAAAALSGLCRLWELTITLTELETLALSLGSDVPVCLRRKPARIEGVGERVTHVTWSEELAQCGVLLVNPGVPLLTADVYRAFTGGFVAPLALPPIMDTAYIAAQHNALEAPAISRLPVIKEVLSAVAATSGCVLVRMSGSGGTCFGLYKDVVVAQHAAAELALHHPQWWIQATHWYNYNGGYQEDDNGKTQ